MAQPLLDLFGRNPEFFVASGSTRPEIVAFALVIAFAIPALALATEVVVLLVVGPKAAAMLHGLWFALLGFVLGLALAADLGQDGVAGAVVVGAVVSGGLILLRRRFAGARLMLRYLGLAPLLFLALFLFTSATGDLLWAGEAGAEADVQVGGDAPVVVVMFDELPSGQPPAGGRNDQRDPVPECGPAGRRRHVVPQRHQRLGQHRAIGAVHVGRLLPRGRGHSDLE